METKALQSFIEEAELMLGGVRGCILAASRKGGEANDLDVPVRYAELLAETAFTAGNGVVALEASELADMLRPFQLTGQAPDMNVAAQALDKIALMEANIAELKLGGNDLPEDMLGLIDDSFDDLMRMSLTKSPPVPDVLLNTFETTHQQPASDITPDESEFEIDEELREVFALEADDLLTNINENLDKLSIDANDREALWEIRRNAHTFKGAAGVVGFKIPSKIAHRIEDFLDHLNENKIDSNERIFALLHSATDCLKQITHESSSPDLAGTVDSLFADFDIVMSQLSAKIETAQPAQTIQASQALPVKAAKTEEKQQESAANPSRSIIRVSASILDDIVRSVRELVEIRSGFERRLEEFETQISDLVETGQKLQSASTRLETEMEATMLSPRMHIDQSSPNQAGLTLNTAADLSDFDALEFDRYSGFHRNSREISEAISDTLSISTEFELIKRNIEILAERQRKFVDELQNKITQIKMVEFGSVATRLRRVVRVTSDDERKFVDTHINGSDVTIDTQVLDRLIEPLSHLLRNAVVHGIEPPDHRRLLGKPENGSITMTAANEDTHLILTVTDDGKGIAAGTLKRKAVENGMITAEAADALNDKDAVQLLFLPGLTTADKLSLSAGRGVGMSIVKECVEALEGTISVTSRPQLGTTFSIKIPLSMVVLNTVVVRTGDQEFAIPAKPVKQICEVFSEHIKHEKDGEFIILGDGKFKLERLSGRLGLKSRNRGSSDQLTVLIIEKGEMKYALAIDEILRSEELMVKKLGKPLDEINGYLGAAVSGSGKLVPIINVSNLPSVDQSANNENKSDQRSSELVVMIVDDSPSVRLLTSRSVEAAGWKSLTAKDGREALYLLRAAEHLPSIILSDVEMPVMDGYELVKNLKEDERLKNIPVVMITSRTADKHRQKAAELGVDDYLTKPYNDKTLVEKIKELAGIAV